ncbi:16S rRNA (cytidine(1402)-2'-O)-methyltransferase [Paenibacillus turpanensis]|uniref:16S rRNA (cytidine(1402)-2'-O)-methyltransferase n=1 Tax=Paenibacillus turpanensis TaxID=2689078 RepID=UPI001409292B|nr:16S rRNA (cytidine(1402)-2'-O)-methyltransferase [Paenibacillus turpanensis]
MGNIQQAGTLYLVSTPIGNLEDMTFRAIRILKEADWIAAEDTRQTKKLLTHFEIEGPRLVSYHEHNKMASGPELIKFMLEGQQVALVSDAGMPAISDPGADLVALAIEAGISVIPVPGANAALSALIISGLPTDSFLFLGFPPREKKKLRELFDKWKGCDATMIFYESPHRIEATMQTVGEAWGMQRKAALVRELTKRYEEAIRGTVEQILGHLEQHPPKGEFVLVLEGASEEERAQAEGEQWWASLSIEEHVAHYERETGNSKEAIKLTAGDRKLPKREVYQIVHTDENKKRSRDV